MNGGQGLASAEVGLQVSAAAVSGTLSRSTVATDLQDMEQHPQWAQISMLPMHVTAAIPLPCFKVRDLLGLSQGQLLVSDWASSADVPLNVGETRLSWTEFDVVEQRLAVRLTRLA